MNATEVTAAPGLASRLVNLLLSMKPLANFAKSRARSMMIQRAEAIGVPWRQNAQQLSDRDWQADLAAIAKPLTYPEYYLRPFHAYEQGDLCWEAAWEVESAAQAVHAGIWPDAGPQGDARLRQSYHGILAEKLPNPPARIVDLGCSVGMSTFALQECYPQAAITGVDLSPYFLAVAHYRSQERGAKINWIHAWGEATGLPAQSFDLVSAFLIFHELPQTAARDILREARRLLPTGGHLAIMDMNPRSQIYQRMPPYILTLLKSTEPYLDDYFSLDIEAAIAAAGFAPPRITANSPRHRTIVAQAI